MSHSRMAQIRSTVTTWLSHEARGRARTPARHEQTRVAQRNGLEQQLRPTQRGKDTAHARKHIAMPPPSPQQGRPAP